MKLCKQLIIKHRMRSKKSLQKTKVSILQLGVFVSIIVAGVAAFAENAYLAVTDNSGYTSFTNCVNWRIGSASGRPLGTAADPVKLGYDYIVPGGKTLRTPIRDTSFGGDSLMVEGNGTFALCAQKVDCEYTFPGNGLFLKGYLYNWRGNSNGADPIIKGKVTVPANTTAQVSVNNSTDSIRFDCAFSGESTSMLWAYGYQPGRTCKIRFVGETLKDYSGQIVCCSHKYADRDNAPDPTSGATLSSGTVTSLAKVTINPYCTITAESAGDVVSVAELVMKTNSTISVVYDKSSKTASCIKVSGTFTHDEGPVKIAFEPNPTLGTWPDSEIVPELSILKAPSGVTLSTNNFVLVTSAQFPVYELYVRTTEDGLSTLCVHQVGKVIQQASDDPSATAGSSFVSGDTWDGGELPNVSNCYYSVKTQRAYGNPCVFLGRALARISGQLSLKVANVRIDDFRIVGNHANDYGVKIYADNSSLTEMTLEGRLRLMSINNYASLYGHGRTFAVASEIDGPGKLRLILSNGASTVKLLAMNDFFTGKIEAECANASDNLHNVLQFADGRSLGGAMSSWTYDGHTFNAYTYFVPLASTTLERENCGIYVADYARIVCNEGITLTVKERVTWNGEIKKLGAGTLAWGGEEPYFTTDGGTTPVANMNKLVIAEGALRAASSEAFHGVAVTVADGATLAVDVQADTESDLARYGMDLRPSGSSLAIEASSIRPVVSVPAGMQKPKQAAICTVSAEAAAALRGKFGVPVASSGAYGQPVVFERANDDGSVTFGIEFQRGFRIIFR